MHVHVHVHLASLVDKQTTIILYYICIMIAYMYMENKSKLVIRQTYDIEVVVRMRRCVCVLFEGGRLPQENIICMEEWKAMQGEEVLASMQ